MNKDRIERKIQRDVRALTTISCRRSMSWLFFATWPVLLFQSSYASINVYLNLRYDWTAHSSLLMLSPGQLPFLLGTLQFISAFMTGLALNDAVGRFKNSMTSLLGFKNSLESLRTTLLASTSDPGFETAVQTFLAFAVVLLHKEITFFTEDWSHPILEPVCEPYHHSVLLKPEVLWTFSRRHWQFIFQDFLTHSYLLDPGGNVKGLTKEMIDCWKRLEDLFTVRAPRTRHYMTMLSIQLFFFLVPLFNDDVTTQIMTPLVATMFAAMMQLAIEMSDPWDEHGLNSVPLTTTLHYLAMPVETLAGSPECVLHAIQWLNRGLCEGVWTSDSIIKIPREKHNYPNIGRTITFEFMRTIPEIVNRRHWPEFLNYVGKDMDAAIKRGRRMPVWIRDG